jgi:hypothetical protein
MHFNVKDMNILVCDNTTNAPQMSSIAGYKHIEIHQPQKKLLEDAKKCQDLMWGSINLVVLGRLLGHSTVI